MGQLNALLWNCESCVIRYWANTTEDLNVHWQESFREFNALPRQSFRLLNMTVEYVYRGRKNLGDRFYVFLYSASLAKGLSGALVTDTRQCFYLGIMYHSDISQAHSTDCKRMTEYLKSRLPNKFNFYKWSRKHRAKICKLFRFSRLGFCTKPQCWRRRMAVLIYISWLVTGTSRRTVWLTVWVHSLQIAGYLQAI